MKQYPTKDIAEKELEKANAKNSGKWVAHSRFVAIACEIIAEHSRIDGEKAYVLGLLHDIGRREGVTSIRHILDGYNYCKDNGWLDVAKICLTHSYPIKDINTDIGQWDITAEEKEFINNFINTETYDDYDKLVQLCDALATSDGLCLLEKRFVDVTRRYGFKAFTIDRWNAIFEIKKQFESVMNCSVYSILPNVRDTTFL